MKRIYYADDGGIEVAMAREVAIEGNGRCYHCERWMHAGESAVELTDTDGYVYVLHQKCAKRNVEGMNNG